MFADFFENLSPDLRARVYWERRMEYSLFVLLIFFVLLTARLYFKRGKINKRNKECSIPRS